jgi:hypothetical protein
MGLPRVPVAIWIGVTVPGPELGESATYPIVPSGVIAMATGLSPALTAVPGRPEAALITVMVPGVSVGTVESLDKKLMA